MPIAISVILNNWRIILACAAMLVAYHFGTSSVQAKWDASISLARAEIIKKQNNEAILSNIIGEKHEVLIQTIGNNYDAAIASLQPTSSNMLKPADTSCELNEKASADRIYKATKRIKLGREAEINTASLIGLQNWVSAFCGSPSP